MKKVGQIALLCTAFFIAGCNKSINTLQEDKLKLTSEHKESIRNYNQGIHDIDSMIANHPEADTSVRKIKTIPVTVDTVQVVNFEHYFEVHGNLEAEENSTLFAEVPGNVKSLEVREGARVKKRQILLRLDASTLESSIAELETARKLAKDLFEKQNNLWKQKIGSEVQYLQAKANKESLDQKLKTAKEQLDMYAIRAPFGGIIDEIMPKVGEAAIPGVPLARIINLNKMYLEADVSEKYIETVVAGGLVEIKFPSINENVTAKVTRTGNFINPANRTFKVKVEFTNSKEKFKPNQLAVLRIRDYLSKDAIVIPSKIIQQDRIGQDYIYSYHVVDNVKRVKKLIITVGRTYRGYSEIIKGLKPNTIFINKGSKTVQNENAIEIK